MKKLCFATLFFLLNSHFSSAQPSGVLKVLGKTAKHVSKIFLLPPGALEKPRSLTLIEKSQVRLLACVENIITENKGGSQAFSIAQQILLDAMENTALSTNITDTETLSKSYIACRRHYDSLVGYSDREVGKQKKEEAYHSLPSATPEEQKTKELLYSISYPKVLFCSLGELSAEGAWVIGIAAGLNKLKCLYSNGKVKNGFGVGLRFLMGGGAAVRIHSHMITNATFTGPFMFQSDDHSTHEVSAHIVPVVGAIDMYIGQSLKGFAIGAGAFGEDPEAGAGIRFFNGKRRWNVLLDILK